MGKIQAKIVAHSKDLRGNELITYELTLPRIILAELNTHRMFSRNTSSSRAVPFKKMVETIMEKPFIPIAWQKHHTGMQGTEYLTSEDEINRAKEDWLNARTAAVQNASYLYSGAGVTKQLANRLLEPWMWVKTLMTTGSEGLNNFFVLRCPKYEIPLTPDDSVLATGLSWKSVMQWEDGAAMDFDTVDWLERESFNNAQAEIHIQALAEAMYDALRESEPKKLRGGEWHIPYEDHLDQDKILAMFPNKQAGISEIYGFVMESKVKIATAMAARVSYTTIGDEKELDYGKMIKLHDKLIELRHDSPLEHCAQAMDDYEFETFIKGRVPIINWYDAEYDNDSLTYEEPSYADKGWANNFKGFIPYRYKIERTGKLLG